MVRAGRGGAARAAGCGRRRGDGAGADAGSAPADERAGQEQCAALQLPILALNARAPGSAAWLKMSFELIGGCLLYR